MLQCTHENCIPFSHLRRRLNQRAHSFNEIIQLNKCVADENKVIYVLSQDKILTLLVLETPAGRFVFLVVGGFLHCVR